MNTQIPFKRLALFLLIFILPLLACFPSINFSNSGVDEAILELVEETETPLPILDEAAPPTLSSPEGAVPTIQAVDLISQQNALIEIYENVNPGVVAILVETEAGFGSGSGFVIDKTGHIVTNYHVIDDAVNIQVWFPSGVKTRGQVIGTDTDSDLAIVKVDVDEKFLFPLPLGDSSEVRVGQIVVAIGNPFGYNSTMTTGIISATGRSLDSINEAPGTNSTFTAGAILQTDASINPGNSGGPLLNLEGEVIGVNRAIQTISFDADNTPINSGIGFAVEVNIVKRVVPGLIENGFYNYPYLGISSRPEITLEMAESLGLERAIGTLVVDVVTNGPADQANIRVGDIIIGINDHEVRNFDDLIAYLFTNTAPGDTIIFTIIRDGAEIELELVVGARP